MPRFLAPVLLSAAAFALSACIPANPVVSDFNGDSVKVQDSALAEGSKEAATVEATRICAKRNRRAEYASVRDLGDYRAEYLFLCL